jgi:hypothetical protein
MCLVLSTGRCGSTALSNIVRGHPGALSVSELFSALADHDLTERALSGEEFWAMLSTPSIADMLGVRFKIEVPEMLYPVRAPRAGAERFTPETGVPPLMQVTLPHLTDRPDDLYAELEEKTVKLPVRLLSEHFAWLFGELAGNRVPGVIVERSGGSIAYCSTLLRLFPQALVVHLYRDGRECAASMSRHDRYKIAAIRAALRARVGYDPYASAEASSRAPVLDPGDELAVLMPNRISRPSYEQFGVPLRRYGAIWSKMIVDGVAALRDYKPLLELDYVDLTECPLESIGRLFDFLGLPRNTAREQRMAAGLRPGPDVRKRLGQAAWDDLTKTCRLGMNRLYGQGGWT